MTLETIVKSFVANLVRWATTPPKQPQEFLIRVTGEEMRKNITEIALPPLAEGNPDNVVKRQLTVVPTAEGSTPLLDVAISPSEPQAVVVKLAQGVEVKISLIDVDQADNASLPRDLIFTPSDVTPPTEPGDFQLKVSGEVEEA